MQIGEVELIVTADVGPRILRCGFIGGPNMFIELPDQLGRSGEPWWMLRGGHRLWTAPETQPDTYALDNLPVQVSRSHDDCSLSFLQPIEKETSLRKQITLCLRSPQDIRVTHRIENCGLRSRLVAPWALTALAPGGLAITTFPARTRDEHPLQPTNPLVMWSYTDFTDPRWLFLSKYLVLRQDSNIHSPQKAGLFNEQSFACYLLGTVLFVKRSKASSADRYPDFQSSVELFTNGDFLELETLGPQVDLEPGQAVEHVEHWSLLRDVHLEALTEQEVDRILLPLMHKVT